MITVNFHELAYSVDESIGVVRPVLVLSNPSSFVEIVQVITTDASANGMNDKYVAAVAFCTICAQYDQTFEGQTFVLWFSWIFASYKCFIINCESYFCQHDAVEVL